jgi:hypothetical protein
LLGSGARFRMNQQTRYALAIVERDHGARIAGPKKSPDPRFTFGLPMLDCKT